MSEWFNQKEKCAGVFRIKIVWWFCLVFGRRVSQFLIFFIVVFAYPFLNEARKSAKEFFDVLNNFERQRGLKITTPRVFKLIYNYSLSMLDKMLSLAKRLPKNSISFADSADSKSFKSLVNSGKGAVLIFSHIGNFEVLGSNGAEEFETRKPEIFAMVEDWSDSVFRNVFLSNNSDEAFYFLDVSNINIATFEKLNSELERGNLIIIAGDRISKRSPQKFFEVEVLGKKCKLPSGVFQLASMLKHPVFFANCIAKKNGYLANFKDVSNLPPSKKRGENLAKEYATFLEKSALDAPYQWFNFFDFFKS